MFAQLLIVKDQEELGDIIAVRLLQLLRKKQAMRIDLSEEGKKEITALHGHVCSSLYLLTEALQTPDKTKAATILTQTEDFDRLEIQTERHHLLRVQKMVSASEATHELHLELVDVLKQIQLCCKAIAKNIQT